jgi:hypothetical protein
MADIKKLFELVAEDDELTVAQEAAKSGQLPKDLDLQIVDSFDTGAAHGYLPKEFIRSVVMDAFKELCKQAKEGTLPKDFKDWDIADEVGWSVAHVAAEHGHLPSDFDQWDLATKRGWTVAHVAAQHKHLLSDFDQWTLVDEDNWTIAYEAAFWGHLPDDFPHLDWVDNRGVTVADVLEGSS